ncbi:hypothetical protein MKW98_026085 [Papaver atlanticum]|uniref:RRM domain-containing protein n=1 Tax=Papaver atlanticum TaxID=357466 RepID=A0AAD4X4N6_9MAGN|nr:hypothetical protein MKW98_026085 [Papaver atlanticum]
MAMKQRVEDEVDTEPEMDSELDDAQVEEDKQQLIDIIRSISTENIEIIQEIRKRADQNPSHCELLVHGLDWETTSDQLNEIFSTYGDIIQCRVVADRITGKSKGYALKEPLRKIGNRIAECRLVSHQQLQMKVFVGNVDSEVSRMKLHSFFSKYGEIEEGPCGFDFYTGKLKGYAMFIYKTVQGARRAVEEPIKRFDGYMLYCQMAIDQRKNLVMDAGFGTQNGVAQPYVQGIFSGAAQPYYGQPTQHVQTQFAAGGQNASSLSVMNPASTGFSPASMSPTTLQQGILGAFVVGNPVCQNPQSHEPNSSCKIEPYGDGPSESHGLGYYLMKLGFFILVVVGIFFLLIILL